MIETPVKESWNSSPPPGSSAKGKRCRSRQEMRASDEWEMDYPFSYFVRALVEGQSEWQTSEPLRSLESVSGADGQISRLRQRYKFRDNTAVSDYLEQNPSLFSLLTEAHDKILKHFGSNTRAILDAVKDSEMDDHERLFVFVPTELSADEALDRLDELYEQWWLGALSGVQPKLSIDVEFV